jgi:hypothetical protein
MAAQMTLKVPASEGFIVWISALIIVGLIWVIVRWLINKWFG